MQTGASSSNPESLALMLSHAYDQIHGAPWWVWIVAAIIIAFMIVRMGTTRVRTV